MYDRYLEAHHDGLLANLVEFVNIPSVSMTGGGMAEAVSFLEQDLTAKDFSVEVHATDGYPIVFAEAGPDGGSCELLVYGHYDVFPVNDREKWKTDPFAATVVGDRLFGRGTGDNKGQILAHVNALRMYREVHGDLPFKVKLIIEGEEETGSKNLPLFVRGHRELLKADVCVYSDGPMFPNHQPVLLFGVRGALCLELVARGAKRALHSGNFGGVAPTPALDLCRLLSEMRSRDGELLVPGAMDGVREIGPLERRALSRLPLDREGIDREIGTSWHGRGDSAQFYERLMTKPSLNLAGISAGHTEEGFRGVIPNRAVAKIDVRLVDGQDPDHVYRSICEFIRDRGYDHVECRKLVAQPASKTPLDCPYTPIVSEAVARGFGRQPVLAPGLGATTPDYVFTGILGIPSIVVPYAPHDEANHAPNESILLSSYFSGMKCTAHLVEGLARRAGDSSTLERPR